MSPLAEILIHASLVTLLVVVVVGHVRLTRPGTLNARLYVCVDVIV